MGFLQLMVYGVGLILSLAWGIAFVIGSSILQAVGKTDDSDGVLATLVGAPFVLAGVYLLTQIWPR